MGSLVKPHRITQLGKVSTVSSIKGQSNETCEDLTVKYVQYCARTVASLLGKKHQMSVA